MEETKKRVNLTINGSKVSVEQGATVFQAAEQAGIFIPHYCYHPDLSIAGVCRMCMVEVEKIPRLQISCNTMATEGMIVRTDTEKVKNSVKNTLELHLINHPLDCPICDKAGECKLQDFYRDFGLYQSRMSFEKVHKPKVVDIGTIVLDSERCILCTRCVRFTDEVTGTNELGIFNRGDRSELKTYDSGPLDNDYTGNLADICPVGALTAKDFRFECRVWFLEKTKTVCTMCARGCNTEVSVKPQTKEIYRVEPRRNTEVNKSWICDTGRWDYRHVKDQTRIQFPLEKENGNWVDRTWHQLFADLRQELEEDPASLLIGLSTQITNEEAWDAFEILPQLGVKHIGWIVDETKVGEKTPWDGILKHRDLTGNAAGFKKIADLAQFSFLNLSKVQELVKQGQLKRVWLLGLEGITLPGLNLWLDAIPEALPIVMHTTNRVPFLERAQRVLPNASSFEKSGTMINALDRVQKLSAALPKQFLSRDLNQFLFGISQGGDRQQLPDGWVRKLFDQKVSPQLFAENKQSVQQWRRMDPLGVAL